MTWGKFYRLISPFETSSAAWMFVCGDDELTRGRYFQEKHNEAVSPIPPAACAMPAHSIVSDAPVADGISVDCSTKDCADAVAASKTSDVYGAAATAVPIGAMSTIPGADAAPPSSSSDSGGADSSAVISSSESRGVDGVGLVSRVSDTPDTHTRPASHMGTDRIPEWDFKEAAEIASDEIEVKKRLKGVRRNGKEHALVLAMNIQKEASRALPRIRLRGLAETGHYQVEELVPGTLKRNVGTGQLIHDPDSPSYIFGQSCGPVLSGRALMAVGLPVKFEFDGDSIAFRLIRID